MIQELLAKTDDPELPLEQQEYYELRLDDLGFPFRPQFVDKLGVVARHRFIVFQAHAVWSEIDGQIMWDNNQHDECSSLREAEDRYEIRRAALVRKGFTYSDMDY